jgi:hypothetical protein
MPRTRRQPKHRKKVSKQAKKRQQKMFPKNRTKASATSSSIYTHNTVPERCVPSEEAPPEPHTKMRGKTENRRLVKILYTFFIKFIAKN